MKGKYEIKISNNKVAYTLLVERNITILTGDSGIGKSSLTRLVQNYEEYGKKSGVTIKCRKECRTISSNQDWEERLEKIHNSIIFIDEGKDFLRTHAFARAVEGNDNYFVLITREALPQLAYSVNSILTLKETIHRKKRVYSKAYPCYSYLQDFPVKIKLIEKILTEDSNSGHQMYSTIARKYNKICETAGGKSLIAGKLARNIDTRQLVIADGAAFGSEIRKVTKFMERYPDNLEIYLPESFEWVLLKSGIIHDESVKRILDNPSKYIDSKKYVSWERYFTDLLIRTVKGTTLSYKKDILNPAYLKPANINKVIAAIEQKDVSQNELEN